MFDSGCQGSRHCQQDQYTRSAITIRKIDTVEDKHCDGAEGDASLLIVVHLMMRHGTICVKRSSKSVVMSALLLGLTVP